jgi:Ser/Thr protein kinase RdoA (MazF antagonist)
MSQAKSQGMSSTGLSRTDERTHVVVQCDGQRPACANCIKSTRECVYDTNIRDSNTRALQLANQELREQLDASNLLLRQLASGAPEVRGPILEFLAGNKQPQEIIRALRIDHSLGLRPKSSERRQGM